MFAGSILGGVLGFLLVNIAQPRIGFLFLTALLGGVLALIIVALTSHRSVGTTFDLLTPSLVGAWAVGNVGCFLAGCCVGQPTVLPWGVRFSADATPLELRQIPVHSAQLYSMLFEIAVLVWLLTRPRRFPGEMGLTALFALLVMRVLSGVLGVTSGGFGAISIAFLVVAVLAAVVFVVLWQRWLKSTVTATSAGTP